MNIISDNTGMIFVNMSRKNSSPPFFARLTRNPQSIKYFYSLQSILMFYLMIPGILRSAPNNSGEARIQSPGSFFTWQKPGCGQWLESSPPVSRIDQNNAGFGTGGLRLERGNGPSGWSVSLSVNPFHPFHPYEILFKNQLKLVERPAEASVPAQLLTLNSFSASLCLCASVLK